jgi:hypothetical protein
MSIKKYRFSHTPKKRKADDTCIPKQEPADSSPKKELGDGDGPFEKLKRGG